jgi:WD repeat-containing protein 23
MFQYSDGIGGHMDDDDDDEEEEEFGGFFGYRRRIQRGRGDPAPEVPSKEGAKLMASGDFGSNSYYTDELKKRRTTLATRTMWRELGIGLSGGPRKEVQSISQVSVFT